MQKKVSKKKHPDSSLFVLKTKIQTIVGLVMVIICVLYLIQNFFLVFRQSFRELRFIALNPLATYDEKMRIYWWGVYDLLQFVKKETPENAIIAIPPQERPWLTSGNGGIVRYFLYPREVKNGTLEGNLPEGVDFVLISHGEWEDAAPEKYDWPKINIKSQEIIYFDPAKKEQSSRFPGDFNSKSAQNKGAYGLIKL